MLDSGNSSDQRNFSLEQVTDTKSSGSETSELALRIGNSSKILKSQVKSMILNVILIVDQDCDLDEFPGGMHHHANVEVHTGDMVVNVKQHTWGSLDVYQDNLKRKISDITSLSGDAIFCLLKDLAKGVKRLHDMKKPHGKIIPENVFVSTDDRNHPYLTGSESNNNLCNPQDDIKDLGRLFYFVLSNGMLYEVPQSCRDDLECDEKTTAWDLITKMTKECPITMEDVLDHPMFWSDNQKLQFLTDVFDSVSHDKNSLKHLDTVAIGEVFESEWKEALKMKSEEKDGVSSENSVDMDRIFRMAGGAKTKKRKNLSWKVYLCDGEKVKNVDVIEEKKWKRILRKLTGNGDSVIAPSKERIEQLINEDNVLKDKDCEIFSPVVLFREEEDGGFDGKSFYDLLRFIRNRKAHYSEADELAKRCFNAAGGLWKFFISRYPRLLVFIHNNMNSFPHYCPHD